ncbi:META domain-containing protein [Conyzicola sp.]|uniref:META domain-containing protein n=1 Tax=Conyzicola sp. TaxID=1969404 RepID=UPI003988C01F
MRRAAAIVVALAALAVTGCASDSGNRGNYGEEDPMSGITGEWQLTKGSDAEGAMIVNGMPVTLVIAEEAVSGQGPCNVYGGDATIDGTDIGIGTLTSTMMACEEDARTQLETRYFAALETVTTSKLGGGDPAALTLSGPDASLMFTIIEKRAAN